jgi:large-conductance mechanosensitive channel
MDDTPKAFLEELRTSLLKRRVGQIALAVVFAETAWHFVSALTWYLVMPLIARALEGNTESVLMKGYALRSFPWENLSGSVLEFASVLILVFYLNRWVQRKPQRMIAVDETGVPEYSMVGQPLTTDQAEVQNPSSRVEHIVD